MKGKSAGGSAPRRTPWVAAVVVDATRVTVLLGAVAALVLVAHSRLIEQPLTTVIIWQYAAVLGLAGLAFAMVPRAVRGTTPGYAGACALGGFLAVLALAWLVEVDLSTLLAAPTAAAQRIADVPLRDVAATTAGGTGPSVLGQMASAALAVDPVYLALWAGVGATGGAVYGWATRALR